MSMSVPNDMPLLSSYFMRSSARFGDRPALQISGRTWSFSELENLINGVVALIPYPASDQLSIGVIASKSLCSYVGIVASMEAGQIYVPLNPKLPISQLRYINEAASISVIIHDNESLPLAKEINGDAILINCEKLPPEYESRCVRGSVVCNSMAYILFTSGSTGNPKAVPIFHRNAIAFMNEAIELFGFEPQDRLSQFTELSFDVSIAEIFLSWSAGACVVVPCQNDYVDIPSFLRVNKITIWSSVPTLAQFIADMEYLSDINTTIKHSLFCGEPLRVELAQKWSSGFPNAKIWNLYGPTEATVFVTYHLFDNKAYYDSLAVPIGRPLNGTNLSIDCIERVGVESCGELLIGGLQVTTGYLKNPDATQKAFVRNGTGSDADVIYRTGDQVKIDASGELIFISRIDRQIKIRGNRVDLQDLEHKISRIEGIPTCVVVPLYRDGLCTDIFAFYEGELSEEIAQAKCAENLPHYMIPSSFIWIKHFPKNSSGKIDHRALSKMIQNGKEFPTAALESGI